MDGEAVPEIINSRKTLLHLDWRNKTAAAVGFPSGSAVKNPPANAGDMG